MPKEHKLKTGQTLEVIVPFEGYPEPTAEVKFGNAPLSSAVIHTVNVTDDTCVVKVNSVERPDQCGTFNIKLTNPYGEDNVDVTLDVHGKWCSFI